MRESFCSCRHRTATNDIKLSCLSLHTVIKEQLRCHSEHLLAVGGATGGRCLIRNLPWRSAFLHNPARPERRRHGQDQDRKSVVMGKSVSVGVDLGGRRIIKKKQEY